MPMATEQCVSHGPTTICLMVDITTSHRLEINRASSILFITPQSNEPINSVNVHISRLCLRSPVQVISSEFRNADQSRKTSMSGYQLVKDRLSRCDTTSDPRTDRQADSNFTNISTGRKIAKIITKLPNQRSVRIQVVLNPLTPTVAIGQVQLQSILYQTGLFRDMKFLTSWHSDAQHGCQQLQMTAELGLAYDALQLQSYGNGGRQRVNVKVKLQRHEILAPVQFRVIPHGQMVRSSPNLQVKLATVTNAMSYASLTPWFTVAN